LEYNILKNAVRIAYIVIFSDQTLKIRQEDIRLLLKGLKIGKRKKKG